MKMSEMLTQMATRYVAIGNEYRQMQRDTTALINTMVATSEITEAQSKLILEALECGVVAHVPVVSP